MGQVVHEGWLKKSPPSTIWVFPWNRVWRNRYFVLCSGNLPGQCCLQYYEDASKTKLRNSINLETCEQVDAYLSYTSKKQQFDWIFDVLVRRGKHAQAYFFAAETEENMNKWVSLLCRVCNLGNEESSGSGGSITISDNQATIRATDGLNLNGSDEFSPLGGDSPRLAAATLRQEARYGPHGAPLQATVPPPGPQNSTIGGVGGGPSVIPLGGGKINKRQAIGYIPLIECVSGPVRPQNSAHTPSPTSPDGRTPTLTIANNNNSHVTKQNHVIGGRQMTDSPTTNQHLLPPSISANSNLTSPLLDDDDDLPPDFPPPPLPISARQNSSFDSVFDDSNKSNLNIIHHARGRSDDSTISVSSSYKFQISGGSSDNEMGGPPSLDSSNLIVIGGNGGMGGATGAAGQRNSQSRGSAGSSASSSLSISESGGYPQQPAGGYQLLAGGYQLPAGGHQVPAGGHQLPAGSYPLPVSPQQPNRVSPRSPLDPHKNILTATVPAPARPPKTSKNSSNLNNHSSNSLNNWPVSKEPDLHTMYKNDIAVREVADEEENGADSYDKPRSYPLPVGANNNRTSTDDNHSNGGRLSNNEPSTGDKNPQNYRPVDKSAGTRRGPLVPPLQSPPASPNDEHGGIGMYDSVQNTISGHQYYHGSKTTPAELDSYASIKNPPVPVLNQSPETYQNLTPSNQKRNDSSGGSSLDNDPKPPTVNRALKPIRLRNRSSADTPSPAPSSAHFGTAGSPQPMGVGVGGVGASGNQSPSPAPSSSSMIGLGPCTSAPYATGKAALVGSLKEPQPYLPVRLPTNRKQRSPKSTNQHQVQSQQQQQADQDGKQHVLDLSRKQSFTKKRESTNLNGNKGQILNSFDKSATIEETAAFQDTPVLEYTEVMANGATPQMTPASVLHRTTTGSSTGSGGSISQISQNSIHLGQSMATVSASFTAFGAQKLGAGAQKSSSGSVNSLPNVSTVTQHSGAPNAAQGNQGHTVGGGSHTVAGHTVEVSKLAYVLISEDKTKGLEKTKSEQEKMYNKGPINLNNSNLNTNSINKNSNSMQILTNSSHNLNSHMKFS